MPYNPRPNEPSTRAGFVIIVHPDMPGEESEIPLETFEHWAEKGFQMKPEHVENVPFLDLDPDPDPPAPADVSTAPEGDIPTSEED